MNDLHHAYLISENNFMQYIQKNFKESLISVFI